jgi:hypothetical protein
VRAPQWTHKVPEVAQECVRHGANERDKLRWMARGWESKDVESQVDAAAERAALAKLPKLTPEEAARKGERESLQLSRTRVLHDIQTSQNPRYRATLEAALKHLDDKIAALS